MNGSNAVPAWLDLLARILLAAVFIVFGWLQATRYGFYIGYMTKFGVPGPAILLAPAILVELGGGLMLLLGWKTRWAGLGLAIFTAIVTFFFHRYWELDAAQASVQMANFYKNLAMIGGLLYVYFYGAGSLSLDAKETRRPPAVSHA